jgi:hypothetical protein
MLCLVTYMCMHMHMHLQMCMYVYLCITLVSNFVSPQDAASALRASLSSELAPSGVRAGNAGARRREARGRSSCASSTWARIASAQAPIYG